MNKTEVLEFLKTTGLEYEVVEHEAAATVEEINKLNVPHPEARARNIFLCDDGKRNYYLLTLRELLPIRITDFKQKIKSRHLSFASAEDLMNLMEIKKGSVSPLAVLNDTDCRIHVYFDAYYEGRLIGVHPNENTAMVFMQCEDLAELLRAHGNQVDYVDLESPVGE
ncbi:MAG: prolyl-tRNA synthetase associated domain-containing protein [Parasporobacterium sp.]|nr:prolyl-tRNA synthetase associated domain-containing protein [Parasporobacterium sp.]